jgi:hypothetical protein
MKRLLAGVVVVSLGACGTSATDLDSGDLGGEQGGEGGSGSGSGENQGPPSLRPYAVSTRVDFTIEAILPQQIELVVVTLREFSINPARALISVADQAGVPAVKALYDVIPGVIKDKLEGWINGEIGKLKINGKTLPQYAGEIAALAETSLTQFGLDSRLVLETGTATHTLTAVDFSPAGFDIKLPIKGLAADILTQQPTIEIQGHELAVGEQHFGLNYGEYAWQGINLASTSLFGADIRTSLGNAIKCPQLAKAVSTKCVGTVCVGHEAELTAICNGGLDAIVNYVHDRIAAFRLEVFHFASGDARFVDDNLDGIADRIVDGTWDAEMNLGLGLRHAPATFTARREVY